MTNATERRPTNNSMSVNKIDLNSRAYFLREGREIGFLRECISQQSITEKAIEHGLSVTQWDEIQFDDTAATVYALPKSSLPELRPDDCAGDAPLRPDRGADFGDCGDGVAPDMERKCDTGHPGRIFVAEYPVTQGGSADFCTYVFVTEPDADCLERAHTIQRLKHQLCFGDLEPTFICQGCGERTHWLLTPKQRTNPLRAPVDVKFRAVKQRICGQEDPAAKGCDIEY